MRLAKVFLVGLALLGLVSPCGAQEKVEKSKRPRVAILEIPVAKGAYDGWSGWHGQGNEARMSDVLRDLFTTEFLEEGSGKIRLIERAQIEEIRKEQSFGQGGEVDPSTAVKLGKLLGVKYMITGKITRFAHKKSGFSTGWGVGAAVSKLTGSGLAGAVASDVDIKKAEFTGRLDMRVIDVETGEIIATAKDEGTTSNLGVKVAGTGGSFEFDQTLVSKIFEPVVKKITPKLIVKILNNED